MDNQNAGKLNRRGFLGLAAGASAMLVKPDLVRGTAANSALRLGLIGCGNRGRAVAGSMVTYNEARVVALADIFQDRLDSTKKYFDGIAGSKGYPEIAQMFRGPQAYEALLESKEIDAVVVASPDCFHPVHAEAAVDAGKHVYSEKPAGIDVAGAKRYQRLSELAQGRVSLAVGFQIRRAPPFVELVRRIHAGALGTLACAQGYYYAGALKLPAWPNATPVEQKLRNWYYYREMSGGILIDQGIHVIDIINWTLQAHPLRACGAGGRKIRSDEGNCWDHYNLTYVYPGDVHVTFSSTQFNKGWRDVCERFFGSKGVSEAHYSGALNIYGDEPWDANPGTPPAGQSSAAGSLADNLKDADPEKGKQFIESILTGKYLNEAAQGAETTLSAILGRMAAESGREITWEEMLRSDEELNPGIDLNQLA